MTYFCCITVIRIRQPKRTISLFLFYLFYFIFCFIFVLLFLTGFMKFSIGEKWIFKPLCQDCNVFFLHPQVNYQPSPDIKAAFIILSFSEAHTSWKPFGKYLINIASINVMISNSLSAEREEGRQENSNVSLAPASV